MFSGHLPALVHLAWHRGCDTQWISQDHGGVAGERGEEGAGKDGEVYSLIGMVLVIRRVG